MAKIGKFILENLTTGMYQDSTIIYREYIQNACDAIDSAVEKGVLTNRNSGIIDLFINPDDRYICIDDNGTGVKASEFVSTLGDIANSDKIRGEDKGFRGIGRLCGLAYCKTLRFSTSFFGEKEKSVMICDAETIRKMIYEKEKYTVDQILDDTITYSTESEEIDKHYFRVELIEINQASTDLLDEKMVRDYLSFVAPAPYRNTFFLKGKIQQYAQENSFSIDEYMIKVNGVQIFKEYTTKLKNKNLTSNEVKNYDDITDLEFRIFKDETERIICWMWFGICRFDIQIPECNSMRGLRVRTGNIQIGGDDVVQKLFKEPRGNYYYIGEIFTVDPELVPNSQRDYFNENDARSAFECCLKNYFYNELHHLYYDANRLKNAFKKQADYQNKVSEYNEKVEKRGFIDSEEKTEAEKSISIAKENAEKVQALISKARSQGEGTIEKKIFSKIEAEYTSPTINKITTVSTETNENINKKNDYITQGLSKLNKRERKIVSKIFRIIMDNLEDKEIAKKIIELIKDELS